LHTTTSATTLAPQAPRSHRPVRALVTAAVTALAAALLLTACSAAHAAPSAAGVALAAGATSQGPYVALGDSYTAGLGIPGQVGMPAGCGRSGSSYPFLVAQRLGLKAGQVRDVSCSGATISSLSAAQPTSDGTNPAQLTALTPATTLVTLGIGGNDLDWTTLFTRCVELDLVPALIPGSTAASAAPCREYYTSGGTNQIQQAIHTAAVQLAGALTDIKTRAPHARIYVVGYPALLPSTADDCRDTLTLTQDDLAFLNAEELQLNTMLWQDAQAAGAVYVDTYTPSTGHDACSDPATRWIEPLIPTGAAPMHPNALGEQGIADAVIHAVTATT
jgi:lysophospholipase L1-like esterase